jgi:glycyl-tRNA synthetase
VTLDFETLDDNAVTVRARDTMAQERIGLDAVEQWLSERLPLC